MSDLAERKRKYIEHLLTLVTVLAVFVAFVSQSARITIITNSTRATTIESQPSALNQQLIYFGVLFVIAAFISYTFLLFDDKLTNKPNAKGRGRGTFMVSLILAASFAGIVEIALAYAFTGAAGGSLPLAYLILIVISAMFFAVFYVINRMLNLKEPPTKGAHEPTLDGENHEPLS